MSMDRFDGWPAHDNSRRDHTNDSTFLGLYPGPSLEISCTSSGTGLVLLLLDAMTYIRLLASGQDW